MTNAASPLPATSAWRTVFAMGIAGLCFGFSLAVVPVYLTLDALNEDCAAYTAEAACTATEHTDCVWVSVAPLNASSSTRGGRCDFAD